MRLEPLLSSRIVPLPLSVSLDPPTTRLVSSLPEFSASVPALEKVEVAEPEPKVKLVLSLMLRVTNLFVVSDKAAWLEALIAVAADVLMVTVSAAVGTCCGDQLAGLL